MMKRWIAMLTSLLLLILPACAEVYWTDAPDRAVECCDDRPGCQVLQAVMMGSFTGFSPSDKLSVRVFSAALAQLSAVPEEDFTHFVEYFDVTEDTLRSCYYNALGNCLWADIIIAPKTDEPAIENARRVLLLFLEPADDADAGLQMQVIRESITDETIALLAEKAAVPEGFVRYLLEPKTEPVETQPAETESPKTE